MKHRVNLRQIGELFRAEEVQLGNRYDEDFGRLQARHERLKQTAEAVQRGLHEILWES